MIYSIWDIDGTLNHGPNAECQSYIEKHPKDWDAFFNKLFECPVNIDILAKYEEYKGIKVIMTARGTQYKGATIQWLYSNNVKGFDDLIMRAADDRRPSLDCKLSLMKNCISRYGKPEIVYEDREDIADAFRELDLNVFHVTNQNTEWV